MWAFFDSRKREKFIGLLLSIVLLVPVAKNICVFLTVLLHCRLRYLKMSAFFIVFPTVMNLILCEHKLEIVLSEVSGMGWKKMKMWKNNGNFLVIKQEIFFYFQTPSLIHRMGYSKNNLGRGLKNIQGWHFFVS